MPSIGEEKLRQQNALVQSMFNLRDSGGWLPLWRELSQNYLPQRYRWLMEERQYAQLARRQYIINSTGTQSARTLAAGMMNGITSPSRPWFKLRIAGLDLEHSRHKAVAVWLEQVEKALMKIMAESNFYNSMAVIYLDMVVFGTAASLIYEDPLSVIRCYNPPMGEYALGVNSRGVIDTMSRQFEVTVSQYVERWPDRRYWSDKVKAIMQEDVKGARLNEKIKITHLLRPNDGLVAPRFRYADLYWETSRREEKGDILEARGFNELPGIFSRWELSGNDPYGVSPGMDALGDNIELQHLHKNKAELLEKTHNPAMLVDVVLQNKPLAFMPRGRTYVPNLNATSGAKPIFEVQPRFDQLNVDQLSIEERIRNAFFNFLFNGTTNLQTVRSAAEIDAREREKLILLGGVLERFESEALDPGISRVYSIADRAGLLPPPPPGYADMDLEIQYVSVLSVAQRAAGTAPVERFLGLIGNLAAITPSALKIPKFDRMLINYARDIGVRESELNSLDEIAQAEAAEAEQAQAAQAIAAASELAAAGKNAAAIDMGGGMNAARMMMGGG